MTSLARRVGHLERIEETRRAPIRERIYRIMERLGGTLPTADVETLVTRYAGAGANAQARVTRRLDPEQPVELACEAAIATLDGTGAPQQVFAAAQGLPDPASAEMAVRHASALSHFLGDCISGGTTPAPEELVFTSTILRRRLDELGQ